MMAHTNADIPYASAKNRTLNDGVDRVIHRAMAKDPEDRYPAALAFVDSLQAALAGEPLTHNAEPADGFRLYTGAHTPVRESPPVEVAPRNWPTSVPPQSPTHLLCPNCLGTVEADDMFCGGCGVRVLWCRTCRGPRIATDRFCSHCGAVSEASDTR
jgi:hypothetical protein